MQGNIEEYRLRRLEREQRRDRERAAQEAREREWERERQRERETNRKILIEREKERERVKALEKAQQEKEEKEKNGKMNERESNAMNDDEEDEDAGFILRSEKERDDVLPRLYNTLASIEGFMHLSPVAGFLTGITRDLVHLQQYCLFTMAHPDRPLSWRMGYFSAIPIEIQAHVLSFTDLSDLWRVRCVGKLWNAITQRESYWINLLERNYSPLRNRLHAVKFNKTALWLYRSKAKKLCVRDHITGDWIGWYWNKTTLSLWEGEWKDGRIFGYGVRYIPASNEFYEGQWKDERLCGYGRAETRLVHFEGDFKENLKHGRGTCTWKASDNGYAHYEGEWQYDLMDGYGTMKYANGNIYSGEWLDGMRDGLGTMWEADTGKEYRGIWERDICQVTFDDKGELVFPQEQAVQPMQTTGEPPSSAIHL